MNLSRSSVLAVAIAAAGVLGLPACAQPDPCNAVLPDSPTGLVWPASPETARVAYVGVLQDNNACQLGPSETPLNLSYPKAIAASPDGRVFVSDRAGVRAIDPKTGHMSVFADKAQSARGIAVAPDGRVFIADNGAKEVFVYSKDGKLMAEMGAGDLQNPQGVAIDVARQRLYVADSGTSSIRAYGLDGAFLSRSRAPPSSRSASPPRWP
jgi:DNA-binding beta-propeller fold protein YncE